MLDSLLTALFELARQLTLFWRHEQSWHWSISFSSSVSFAWNSACSRSSPPVGSQSGPHLPPPINTQTARTNPMPGIFLTGLPSWASLGRGDYCCFSNFGPLPGSLEWLILAQRIRNCVLHIRGKILGGCGIQLPDVILKWPQYFAQLFSI